MKAIYFSVVGTPLAMPRARASAHMIRIAGKLKAVAKIYTPEDDDVNKWKHDIIFEASKAFHAAWPDWDNKPPLETPLAIELNFIFPRSKEITWKRKPMLRQWYIDVPDLDNLQKAVLDALNGVIYRDDRQVVRVVAQKIFADGTEPPAVHVLIQEIQPVNKEQNVEPLPPSHQ